jgi:GrpB-like predicted nucleotidyltransferase (UPF0157 family)
MGVTIEPYDSNWVAEFEAERDRIAAALGAAARRIAHTGSTAIPGLAAKPIIDIQLSVEHLHPIETFVRALEGLGYTHLPHADDAFCPFLYRPAAEPHTHHVHLVEAGGAEERRTLAFRDYLRDHPLVATEYETLKRSLARQHIGPPSGGGTYSDGKTEFVERVVRAALAAGYPRDSPAE